MSPLNPVAPALMHAAGRIRRVHADHTLSAADGQRALNYAWAQARSCDEDEVCEALAWLDETFGPANDG